MKNVILTIDGLNLNQPIIDELKKWYDSEMESDPESFVGYIDKAKDTLIRVMCDDESSHFTTDIKESLAGLLRAQDSLKRLIPEKQ